MFILAIVVVAVAAVWRTGVYRHWRDYHATICYMILCNLLYYFLVQDRILWEYTRNAFFDHALSELIVTFVVFPCTVMLFLHAMMTAEGGRRALRLAKWIVIYLAAEWIGSVLGVMEYNYGWGYYWSVLFVVTMFPMLLLHHTRPLIAYALSIIAVGFYMIAMKVPYPLIGY